LEQLLELKAMYPQAKMVVGNTEIGSLQNEIEKTSSIIL